MKQFITATVAIGANCLEIKVEAETNLIWVEGKLDITDYKYFYEATEGPKKCASLPGPHWDGR